MEKSKAYTPEKPYMCVYETKEDGIGYATFDNEEALMELLNECRENGDKILDACKVEDRYEFKDGKFESKYQRMYEYAVIKAIKDKHKELGNKLRQVINERIAIEEKLADTNMPYQIYTHLLREKEDIEKKEEKLSQRKQIVRDMLDVCYEAVWECDDHIDKMKL
jgi:hypothetical protein